jgi:hypothetical protein
MGCKHNEVDGKTENPTNNKLILLIRQGMILVDFRGKFIFRYLVKME